MKAKSMFSFIVVVNFPSSIHSIVLIVCESREGSKIRQKALFLSFYSFPQIMASRSEEGKINQLSESDVPFSSLEQRHRPTVSCESLPSAISILLHSSRLLSVISEMIKRESFCVPKRKNIDVSATSTCVRHVKSQRIPIAFSPLKRRQFQPDSNRSLGLAFDVRDFSMNSKIHGNR